MKPKTSGEWFKAVMEILVLPIFGLVTYILNAISNFDNVNSFKNRPEYVYDIKPADYNKSDKVYVLSGSNCTTQYTNELVDFVNGIKTGYIIFLFVFCFIFCTLSFIGGTICKIAKYFSEAESPGLKKGGLVATIFTYLSFVFSVPVLYSSKVKYGDCLKIEGIIEGYMNKTLYDVCNVGMWFLLFLAFYYSIRNFKNIKQYEKFWPVCLTLVVMWIYAIFFLIMALVTKFGSIWSLQIGWDISLSIDLTYGIVGVKFHDWNIAKVKPFS